MSTNVVFYTLTLIALALSAWFIAQIMKTLNSLFMLKYEFKKLEQAKQIIEDAVLLTEIDSTRTELRHVPPEKKAESKLTYCQGIISDVFMQNGIDYRAYNTEGLINLALFKNGLLGQRFRKRA